MRGSAGGEGDRERCAVCGARDWLAAGPDRVGPGSEQCSHCGLRVDPARYDGALLETELLARLHPGQVALPALGHDAWWTMDAFTLRIAASAVPLWIEPAGAEQAAFLAHPHGPPARARLVPPPASQPPIALAGIARAEAAPTLAERLLALAREAGSSAPVVVIADAPPTSSLPRVPGATLVARPLANDFGAQRCAAQDAAGAAGARWVLQLDDDEALGPDALSALGAVVGQADRQDTLSIGLRRRNLVDGATSDLWPDVQYRLNRAHVRYRGRVHERPDAGHWRHTTIALCATIDHHLARERVEGREREYEAMEAGGGRRGDGASLLRPYAP